MQVTSRGFRAWRVRPMSQSQRDDIVFLAHIREQHRLSLESYALHGRVFLQELSREWAPPHDCKYVRTLGTLPVNYPILGGGSFYDERRT